MLNLILMMLHSLLTGLRNQAAVQAEIIALRHQLIVLQRSQKPERLVLSRTDRCLWVWLSQLWSRWRSALIIVKPETVVGWHRQGFPVVLDMENSSRANWSASRPEGNSRSHSNHESRQSPLGSTSNSRR